ncbi:MAG: type II secretion system protein [Hyphomicrobiales bacterium]|nr:type II secretion system protein [Hyphomicrobiales bacterium]
MKTERSQRGFTLVEMLVAFAIMAISLVAISSGLIGSGNANETALLALEAQSRLVEIGTTVPLEPSGVERRLDPDGRWTFRTVPVTGFFGGDGSVPLYEVQLTGRGESGRMFTLRSYRVGFDGGS